jgi:hypothetical protein
MQQNSHITAHITATPVKITEVEEAVCEDWHVIM